LTPAGWFVLVVSVGSVTTLFAWCVWKVFTAPVEADRVHGFEMETPDARGPFTPRPGPPPDR